MLVRRSNHFRLSRRIVPLVRSPSLGYTPHRPQAQVRTKVGPRYRPTTRRPGHPPRRGICSQIGYATGTNMITASATTAIDLAAPLQLTGSLCAPNWPSWCLVGLTSRIRQSNSANEWLPVWPMRRPPLPKRSG